MGRPQTCAELTILLTLLLSGAIFGSLFLVAGEDSSSPPVVEEAVVITSVPNTGPQCAWSWGTGTDTDGAERLADSLEDAGFEGVSVSVSTFGEWCNPMNPEYENYFAVMDSSPNITLPLDNPTILQDDAALGDMVAEILPIIDNAGLMTPREIVILFQSDGSSREWRALSRDVDRTLAGEAMFAQGTSNP